MDMHHVLKKHETFNRLLCSLRCVWWLTMETKWLEARNAAVLRKFWILPTPTQVPMHAIHVQGSVHRPVASDRWAQNSGRECNTPRNVISIYNVNEITEGKEGKKKKVNNLVLLQGYFEFDSNSPRAGKRLTRNRPPETWQLSFWFFVKTPLSSLYPFFFSVL